MAWIDWFKYFNSTYTNETLNTIVNSTLIHVWNDRSKNTRIECGTNTTYEVIAAKHCPTVYGSSDYL